MANRTQKWINSSRTRTYYAWRNMRRRCNNPKDFAYHNYVGRGITYTPAWESYDTFFADMGECPDKLTLDRIDVNGNYEPNNCRWANWETQHNNKRTNRFITARGVTLTMSQWDRKLGLRTTGFSKRLERMGVERATVPELRQKASHGTRHMYEHYKCKCDECRAANAKRHRERRKQRNERMGQIQGNQTS